MSCRVDTWNTIWRILFTFHNTIIVWSWYTFISDIVIHNSWVMYLVYTSLLFLYSIFHWLFFRVMPALNEFLMLVHICNECTKVQNPRYKDVTLNAYASAYNWTTCGRSFFISLRSDSYLNLWIYGQNSTDSWRTTHYDDRQSPRNKASKIQKLVFRCFLLTSAKAKKFQDGEQSIRLYTTISLQLRRLSKIATIVY